MEALASLVKEQAETQRQLVKDQAEMQRQLLANLSQRPSAPAESTASNSEPPMYPKATEEEIAAEGGQLVDRAIITIDVVPEAVRQKIRNDEYVELAELIHKIPKVFNLVEGEGDLKVKTKEQKSRLTSLDWIIAFQMYANAYSLYYPSARKDLQRYLYFITKLMKCKGSKWLVYDEKFRKERKALKLGWGEYRQLLHTEVLTGAREGSPPASPLTPGKTSQPKSKGWSAANVCFAFNAPGGCQRSPCHYRHACQSCRQSGHSKAKCGASSSARSSYDRKKPDKPQRQTVVSPARRV